MVKKKTLAGAAHDIAHHAASGLSNLSPHFARALREVSLDTAAIALLDKNPYPQHVEAKQPLRMALKTLQATALDIIRKYGFEPSVLASITLHGTPAPWDEEGYTLHTRTIITTIEGQLYDSGWL